MLIYKPCSTIPETRWTDNKETSLETSAVSQISDTSRNTLNVSAYNSLKTVWEPLICASRLLRLIMLCRERQRRFSGCADAHAGANLCCQHVRKAAFLCCEPVIWVRKYNGAYICMLWKMHSVFSYPFLNKIHHLTIFFRILDMCDTFADSSYSQERKLNFI